jgi:hypothetical protein
MDQSLRAILGLVRRPQVAVAGLTLLLAGSLANRAEAQVAFQTVQFSVILPPRTTMVATSSSFKASVPVAGKSTQASVSGSSYGISTNEVNQKIAASLNAPMPRGASLVAALTPPVGAWSAGATALGATATDVVGGVSHTSVDALGLQYTLIARRDAPRQDFKTVVTFTITGGA